MELVPCTAPNAKSMTFKILAEKLRTMRRNMSSSAKSTGATTPRRNHHGNTKMLSIRSCQIFSLRSNLGVEISFKEGRIVTS
jgi:hypothetical protein